MQGQRMTSLSVYKQASCRDTAVHHFKLQSDEISVTRGCQRLRGVSHAAYFDPHDRSKFEITIAADPGVCFSTVPGFANITAPHRNYTIQ